MWNLVSCNVPYERFLRQREEARQRKTLEKMRGMMSTRGKSASTKTLWKGKGLRLLVDREEGIKHENNVLLKKMLTIDFKPSALHPVRLMEKSTSLTSLNRNLRMRFIEETNTQNKVVAMQGLYSRLKTTGATYSYERWLRDSERHQYLSHNLSRNSGHLDFAGSPVASSRPNTVSGNRLRMLSTRQSARPRTEGGIAREESKAAAPL